MTQNFTVPGPPVAQGRPKVFTINGKARGVDPAKSRSWKAFCYEVAKSAGIKAHDGPVWMEITAVWPRPQTVPKWKGTERMPRGSRPDADNVAKAVADALVGLAYHDDCAVTTLVVSKWVAAEGEMPGVHVEISDVEVPKNPKEKA